MILRVTAHMETAIAARSPVQLDALLVQAHPKLSGRYVTRATPENELQDPPTGLHRLRFSGTCVSMCSGWELPSTSRRGREHLVKRKGAEDLEVLEHPWNPALGPGKNRCIPVPLVETPTVSWLAVGSRQSLKKLLRYVQHVGMLRAHGYGAVREWTLEDLSSSVPAERVLITADGRAARHLPALWCTNTMSVDSGAWRDPYWHPSRMGERVPVGAACELRPEVTARIAECH